MKFEEEAEMEIRTVKNKKDKEKDKKEDKEEAEIRVEEETSEETGVKRRLRQEVENDKLEVARNLLLGAIVMEKILSLYMQSSQDIAWERGVEIWPEAQSGDTAWDTGTAWETARGYCLEESQDTAWDPARGYCLEDSQDIDWGRQLEMHSWDADNAWLW